MKPIIVFCRSVLARETDCAKARSLEVRVQACSYSKSLMALCLFAVAGLLGACASFPTTEKQVAASEPQAPQLDIQSWQTEQGAKVMFVHSDALPMLDIRLVMAAGSSRDDGLPGVASLTSALIGQGADALSVDDIARGFEARGAFLQQLPGHGHH